MGLTAKENSVERELIPEGMWDACCVYLADIGTTFSERYGKSQHKVILTWEVPGERIVLERDGKDVSLPKVMSMTYSLSLHQKASLRKALESWRGQRFTAEELQGFDLRNILGVPCQLQVIHAEGSNGKMYANINNILPAQGGAKGLKCENPTQYFSFEDDMDIPEDIPQWIKERIMEADEWKAKHGAAEVTMPDGGPMPNSEPEDDSSLPF